MQLTVRAISNLIGCFMISLLTASCVSQPPSVSKRAGPKLTYQKIFYYPYDNVWRAAQLALKYPIAVNNMDHGLLETDFIKADDGFVAPSIEKLPSSGIRYKISMILAKGRVDGRNGVRVTINKTIEKKRDFFSDAEILFTDGLEEKALLYRMERELIIDEALKKAARSSS